MKLQRAPAAAAQAWYIYKEHHQTLLLQCCLHLNITKSSQCSQKTIASLKISMIWENINYLCYSPAWSVISKPGPKPLNSSLFAKCNWIFPLSIGKISTSNNMFGRTIWDKLHECIFENFVRATSRFSKITRVIYLPNHPTKHVATG